MYTLDVLVIGGSGVDTIVRVPRLDLPVADSHMVPLVHTRAGHTGDNVALGCHALGLRTRLVDVLGDDMEGRLVREMHATAGLDVGWGTVATTKRAVNLVDPQGSRMSYYDSRADPAAALPADLWLPHARTARHVHVCITHPSQAVLRQIPAGCTVSTDLHNWDGQNPYHLQFAEHADIVFMSAAGTSGATPALQDEVVPPDVQGAEVQVRAIRDIRTVHKDTSSEAVESQVDTAGPPRADADITTIAMRRILALGRPRLVIATDGANGCQVMTADGNLTWFPAEPLPSEPVDSNGAGDAFVAGFLRGYLADAGRPTGYLPGTWAASGTAPTFNSEDGRHLPNVPSDQFQNHQPSAHRSAILRSGGHGEHGGDSRRPGDIPLAGPPGARPTADANTAETHLIEADATAHLAKAVRLGAIAGAYACTVPATESRPLTLAQLQSAYVSRET